MSVLIKGTILILDFGGQYCHLISRRIREQGVYTEILPCDVSLEEINALTKTDDIKGIIFSGGPSSVLSEAAPQCDLHVFNLKVPILGLCYGHQLLAQHFGGRVEHSKKKEYGPTKVTIDKPVGVLKDLDKTESVWMSHSDTVYDLPEGFEILAHTDNSPVAAFRDHDNSIHGLQWHPEVSHTEKGDLTLTNFIFSVCGCEANWNIGAFEKKAIDEIKQQIGDGKCILALSGGVDSSTAVILASKAVGKNLTSVFVDHGFMRLDEPEFIEKTFSGFDMNLSILNEKERFLEKLKGVSDPERKRKIIGTEFIRVFERAAKKIGAEYLIQGTIYPDRIESGFRRKSEKIKTHHNVGGLPSKIDFKGIVEPLRELYKDEVRKIAKLLGLPKEIVQRQPFPGPGLAVRIIGEVTQKKLDIIKKADKIVTDEIDKLKIKENLWQYFPVLTGTKSTGVKGDKRTYGYTIAIRAIESKDGMTANFTHIPFTALERISTKITNEIPEVTRVVYDITNKPPATIEWE